MKIFFLILFFSLLITTIIFPSLDLIVSGFFYAAGTGFFLAGNPILNALEWVTYYGSRGVGAIFLAITAITYVRHKPLWNIPTKNWLFLFLALLLGPALIANIILKDHWGRARPREVMEFGGTHVFSPALLPQTNAHANGSFVSGDGSFGFFLPTIAYVVPHNRSRRVFWSMMSLGSIFGIARILMGAHFLSDVLFAGLFMMLSSAALHALMYSHKATRRYWQEWFG
jgi:lipid A 4'-phosphatase